MSYLVMGFVGVGFAMNGFQGALHLFIVSILLTTFLKTPIIILQNYSKFKNNESYNLAGALSSVIVSFLFAGIIIFVHYFYFNKYFDIVCILALVSFLLPAFSKKEQKEIFDDSYKIKNK